MNELYVHKVLYQIKVVVALLVQWLQTTHTVRYYWIILYLTIKIANTVLYIKLYIYMKHLLSSTLTFIQFCHQASLTFIQFMSYCEHLKLNNYWKVCRSLLGNIPIFTNKQTVLSDRHTLDNWVDMVSFSHFLTDS